ncbi:enoyl-CoA hydratase/isomerase family protein [Oesophagostomum dentatum]|uniref:Enoyl-CoA hydratase/isomerase family protein n=1 Tax=Oesophagostomum dentatum TaxID=61180 RepID=A0A0B1RVY1_OESDE|nr:enoyl-CoA hydratase/isomerase family protein [Oesophagostomum dentatum]
MYHRLSVAFEEADKDEDILITVLTGNGSYYSAGTDFSLKEMEQLGSSKGTADGTYKHWVDTLICHSKLVVALVNGPAIGIACTTLALCDVVLASDQAYLYCPFTQLGLCAEGSSSYTFVQTMGYQKAVRLAMLSEKVTAQEAYAAGLVTQVIPHATFLEETRRLVAKYSTLAKQVCGKVL